MLALALLVLLLAAPGCGGDDAREPGILYVTLDGATGNGGRDTNPAGPWMLPPAITSYGPGSLSAHEVLTPWGRAPRRVYEAAFQSPFEWRATLEAGDPLAFRATGPITPCDIATTGGMLLTATGPTTRLVDLATGQQVRTFLSERRVLGCALSPDGRSAFIATDDATIRRFDVEARRLAASGFTSVTLAFRESGEGFAGANRHLDVTTDGRFLVVTDAAPSGLIHRTVIDAAYGRQQLAVPAGYDVLGSTPTRGHLVLLGPPPDVADGRSGDDRDDRNVVCLYDVRAGSFRSSPRIPVSPDWTRLCGDGRYLACIKYVGQSNLELHDLEAAGGADSAPRPFNVSLGFTDAAVSMGSAPRLAWMRSAAGGVELRLFDVTSRRLLLALPADRLRELGVAGGERLAISPDGSRLTIIHQQRVHLLAVEETGTSLALRSITPPSLADPPGSVTTMTHLPPVESDARRALAVATSDGQVVVWRMSDGTPGVDRDSWRERIVLPAAATDDPAHREPFTQLVSTANAIAGAYGSRGQDGLVIWTGIAAATAGNVATTVQRFAIRELGVATLAIAPDGHTLLAVGNRPGTAEPVQLVIDLAAADPVGTMQRRSLNGADNAIELATRLRALLPGTDDAVVRIHNRLERRSADLLTRRAVLGDARRVGASPDGRYLLVQGESTPTHVSVHDARSGLTLSSHSLVAGRGSWQPIGGAARDPVTALSVTGDLVAIATADGRVRLRPFPSCRVVSERSVTLAVWPDVATAVSLSSDRSRMFVGTSGGRVIVFRLRDAIATDSPTALPPADYPDRVAVDTLRSDLAAVVGEPPLELSRVLRPPAMRGLGSSDADQPFVVTPWHLVTVDPGRGLIAFELATGALAWQRRYAGEIVALATTSKGSYAAALTRTARELRRPTDQQATADRLEVFDPRNGRWISSLRVPPGLEWLRMADISDLGVVGVAGGVGGLQWFDPVTGRLLSWRPGHFTVGAFDIWGELIARQEHVPPGSDGTALVCFTRSGALDFQQEFDGGPTHEMVVEGSDVYLLGPRGLKVLNRSNLRPSDQPPPLQLRAPDNPWQGPLALAGNRALTSVSPGATGIIRQFLNWDATARVDGRAGPHPVVRARFSAGDARWLVTLDSSGLFRVHDSSDGKVVVLATPVEPTRKLAFSPDGVWLAELQADGRVWIHNTITGASSRGPLAAAAADIAFARNGQLLLAMSDSLLPYRIGRGDPTPDASLIRRGVRAVATTPDGTAYVALLDDGDLMHATLGAGAPPPVRVGRLPAGARAASVDTPSIGLIASPTGRAVVVATANELRLFSLNGDRDAVRIPASNFRWCSMPLRADAPGDRLPIAIADVEGIRQPGRPSLLATQSSLEPPVGLAGWLPGVVVVAHSTAVEIVEDDVVRYRWSAMPTGDRITTMGLSPDGTRIALATRRGGILVLDLGRQWRERPDPDPGR